MNKKGAVTEDNLVKVIISIAVLLIIAGFVYFFFFRHANPFFNDLPSFNTSVPRVQDVQKIRYAVVDDRVDYYDGNKWIPFQNKNAELGDKVVSSEVMSATFRDYYFGASARNPSESLLPGSTYFVKFTEFISGDRGIGASKPLHRGDVLIELWKKDQDGTHIEMLYTVGLTDNSLHLISVGVTDVIAANPSWKTFVESRAKAWRDSVLARPISVSYANSAGAALQENVCVDKGKVPDLVIDLEQPTTSTVC